MISLLGFLIFDTPNAYTRLVNTGRPLFFIDVPFGLGFTTEQEKMCVGTRCGTQPFSISRVEEYDKYKRGMISGSELITKYNLGAAPGALQRMWFGDSLVGY